MQQGKTFQLAIVAGWLVTSLAVSLVPTILLPEASRSAYFWHRVYWAEFLIFIFWGSTGFYLLASGKVKDHGTRLGGIAPTISIVTAIYAMLSLAVMMIHTFVPETDVGDRIHLIAQVLFFLGATLSVVFLSMARAGAATEFGFDKTKAMSPRGLHDLLALSESSLSTDGDASRGLKASMKQLREALLYSLNDSASLAKLSEYQAFSRRIQSLCIAIGESKQLPGNDDDRYLSQSEAAKSLVSQVKLFSSKHVRR